MDRITTSLIEKFLSENGMTPRKVEEDFEKFCCYLIISKEYQDSFDYDAAWVGGDKDTGIDGIGIIVNGRLVETLDEINDLFEANKYLEVTFILIQAKTSPHFLAADIGTFSFGIKDFFEKKPKLPRNEKIEEKANMMKHIYSMAASFKAKPTCRSYYVTPGIWNNDEPCTARINSAVADLKEMNLFNEEKISFEAIDASSILRIWNAVRSDTTVNVEFEQKALLPNIVGVKAAYVGPLPFSEYRKIIVDENDQIKSNVFTDNIRAFQGDDNPVNTSIKKTIEDGDFDKFVVLNNGITIVAKDGSITRNTLSLRGYQIVNGCQTSHVLFNLRDTPGINDLNIPVRIIITEEDAIINKVITATNNQTSVKREELEAMSEFQKGLEDFYKTYKDDRQLFYERRSKQYEGQPGIIKTRIVTIPSQIKCFASMFLATPHRVSRDYRRIVDGIGTEIFAENHKYTPYYCAAYVNYKIDTLFRTQNIAAQYKKCRFHFLSMIPYLVCKKNVPQINSREIEQYCEDILTAVDNQKKFTAIIREAINIINSTGFDVNDKDVFRIQPTTETIMYTTKIKVGIIKPEKKQMKK